MSIYGARFVLLLLAIVIIWTARDLAISENRRKFAAVRRKARRTSSYFQPSIGYRSLPILAMSSTTDEALGVLTGSWWIHRVGSLGLSAATGVIVASAAGAMFGLAILFQDAFMRWKVPYHFSKILGDWTVVGTLVCSIVPLVFVAFVVEFFIQIVGRLALGLGLPDPEINALLRVRASREPGLHIRSTFWAFSMLELIRDSKLGLFHSRIYSSTSAIHRMADWISSTSRLRS